MISSESGEDTISSEGPEDQMKPVFLFGNPEFSVHPSQVGSSHLMAGVPYPYAEPYFGGLLASYGPQALMVGMAPARVPLPLDLTDDGPIYVNAKQYHGILRRRQSRAKQEAQNKLVKHRKPYLHESRHLHALNRVRGSGGRFLSKKQLQQNQQQPSPTPTSAATSTAATAATYHVQDSGKLHHSPIKKDALEHHSHHLGFSEYVNASRPDPATPAAPDNSGRRFPSGAMQCSGALLHGGTQHCASVVR